MASTQEPRPPPTDITQPGTPIHECHHDILLDPPVDPKGYCHWNNPSAVRCTPYSRGTPPMTSPTGGRPSFLPGPTNPQETINILMDTHRIIMRTFLWVSSISNNAGTICIRIQKNHFPTLDFGSRVFFRLPPFRFVSLKKISSLRSVSSLRAVIVPSPNPPPLPVFLLLLHHHRRLLHRAVPDLASPSQGWPYFPPRLARQPPTSFPGMFAHTPPSRWPTLHAN